MSSFLARVNWSIVAWIVLGLAFAVLEEIGTRSGIDRRFTASHLLSDLIDRYRWFRWLCYFGWAWLGWHLFVVGRHHVFSRSV